MRLRTSAKLLALMAGTVSALNAGALPSRGGFCESPAEVWQEAMLSGNGYTGILVFGDPLKETVIFDSSAFYHPKTKEPYLPDIASVREAVAQKCLEGTFREASQLQLDTLLSRGAQKGGEGARHTGYKMEINIPEAGAVQGYQRICDFETGEIIVR